MAFHHLISNATDSPLPVGEGLGVRSKRVRSNLTKRQIEVTMFAAGVEKLEGLALRLQGVRCRGSPVSLVGSPVDAFISFLYLRRHRREI